MRQWVGAQHSTVGVDWWPHSAHTALLAAGTALWGPLPSRRTSVGGGGRVGGGDEQ